MVPLYKIFLGQSLRFQIRVLTWVLPDNHDIYGQYNSSCENVFQSNLVYSLNPYNVCQGIPVNLSINYSLLVKRFMSKYLYHCKKINYPCMNLFFTNQMNALY